ncbi:SGNH hydrolase [Aspergillus steynii IBT 23096]|uniref:SGNH hydrolase n=1 Tax=Aspergillus steynii IBT 23096 TaxID=1392250 RepID=A0A2I2FUG3_9EURO|nr:SGNH hydrolase [Aspergillus steynii IBT 23096]PLB44280.1 SGNH hydrolase [Aspergillus steynii IBT 23096]
MQFPLSFLAASFLPSFGFGLSPPLSRPNHTNLLREDASPGLSLSPSTVTASINQGTPLRVLSLGDSITLGYNDPTGNSYRRDLQCQLWTGGNPVSMIGSVQHGDWANNHHEAWVYHTIDEIVTKGTPELTRRHEKPNVILLHAGTVNFVLNKNVTEAPARLGAALDFITANNPQALLVVAQLIPEHNATVNALIDRYNAALPAVVAARARVGRRVILAAMRGVQLDMLPDGVHPAGVSSTLMARSFYEAIVEGGRRGLLLPLSAEEQEAFVDEGASAVQPSGECGLALE